MIKSRIIIAGLNTITRSVAEVASQTVPLINSALLYSHGIRRDTTLYVILQERGTLRVDGRHIRNYRPDYLSAKGLVVKALQGRRWKGIAYVEDLTLHDLLKRHRDHLTVMLTSKGGVDLERLNLEGYDKVLIMDCLSVHPEPVEGVLRARIYPDVYTPDQRLAIVQNWLDRVNESWRVEY